MHSLMNQQPPSVNHYNTIPQPAMRQFSNYSQPQQFQDNGMYCSPAVQQSPINQLSAVNQVNQLLRGTQPEGGGGGEFYLHDPAPQKRTWGQPRDPRNHWNTNRYTFIQDNKLMKKSNLLYCLMYMFEVSVI